jgi:hypothetical protein
MPIRKIPKNYRNVTGVAACAKAVGDAQFESTLERDFLDLLEFSPAVETFEVQPLRIEWRDGNGKPHRYTPDVLVKFRPGVGRSPWLCEVKYRADLKKDWSDLHPKLRRGIRLARQSGWRFRLITEVEIRTPYLRNIRFLAPFREVKNRQIPAASVKEILDQLQSTGESTPSALVQSLSPDAWQQAEWLPVLWHLMANHRVATDLECELGMESRIWSIS